MSVFQYHNERLRELLQREIAGVISQELRDPRIPEIVTITSVKLAQDNRNATVYVSIIGDQAEKDEAVSVLNNAAPYIQHVVAKRIQIKHFPRLFFKNDNSIEQGQRINEILKDIEKNDLE